MSLVLKIKKIHPDALIPSFTHPGDAGMDLSAIEDTIVGPGEIVKIRTGITMEIPVGYAGLLWDKSSIGINHGIKTLGGVIDSGYRGEVLVGMINLSSKPYTFEKHHKITQMLIQKVENLSVVEAEELSDTVRGKGGFGSTGKGKNEAGK